MRTVRVAMAVDSYQGEPVITCATLAEWLRWLKTNHAKVPAVWVKMAKKGSGIASIDYPQALEGALIWGWIDGVRHRVDDAYFVQRYTPRRPKSPWSKINCAKVVALEAAGKMKPPGMAAVAAAKADGRWEAAYPSQKNIEVPEDLRAALARAPEAEKFFAGLSKAKRFSFLFRILNAKRPETRAKHVARTVEMCRAGETY